jgi:hypothetical protein
MKLMIGRPSRAEDALLMSNLAIQHGGTSAIWRLTGMLALDCSTPAGRTEDVDLGGPHPRLV